METEYAIFVSAVLMWRDPAPPPGSPFVFDWRNHGYYDLIGTCWGRPVYRFRPWSKP